MNVYVLNNHKMTILYVHRQIQFLRTILLCRLLQHLSGAGAGFTRPTVSQAAITCVSLISRGWTRALHVLEMCEALGDTVMTGDDMQLFSRSEGSIC